MISRSLFVLGSGAAALATARSMAASAADLIPLRVAMSPTDPTAEAFYAQDLGLFKSAGFDVQISLMRNTGALVAGLAGGSLDVIGGSIVPIAAAHKSGIEILTIAPGNIYAGAPTPAVIVTGMKSTIKSGADLNGKTCAVNGIKDLSQVALQAWADSTGGDSKSIKIIEVAFPEIPAALAAGRVEAGMLVEPFASSALNSGQVRVLGDAMSAIGKRFMLTGWFAKASWLADNRDSGHRFTNVMLQTAKWANGHRTESGAILSKYASLPLDAVRGMVRAYYGETPLTAEQAQPVLDAASKYVDLPRIAAADLIWRG
jgi:NitT/TauT family transport system substrate-binding protein